MGSMLFTAQDVVSVYLVRCYNWSGRLFYIKETVCAVVSSPHQQSSGHAQIGQYNAMYLCKVSLPPRSYLRFSGVVREGCVLIGGRVMTQLLYRVLVPKRHSASVLPKEA